MNEVEEKSEKRNKKGIIYLSTLPKTMNVVKLREIMENFGGVGRIFLQPEKTSISSFTNIFRVHILNVFDFFIHSVSAKKNKPSKSFTEGWVEFEKKRVAKEVARGLNNKKIECRKRSELYDFIWNVKYLSRYVSDLLSVEIESRESGIYEVTAYLIIQQV